ncbi:MAG: hypothetical protein ABFD62_17045 [Syntrophaceae bacterium]
MKALEVILLLLIIITLTAIIYMGWDNDSAARFDQVRDRLRFLNYGIY